MSPKCVHVDAASAGCVFGTGVGTKVSLRCRMGFSILTRIGIEFLMWVVLSEDNVLNRAILERDCQTLEHEGPVSFIRDLIEYHDPHSIFGSPTGA
jgi:hypothetical protein